MPLSEILFHRRYSVNYCHSLTYPMGEMSCFRDWAHEPGGDPYPVLAKKGDPSESVKNGRYGVRNGFVTRLLGSFFPWCRYELTVEALKNGEAGFRLKEPEIWVCLTSEGEILCRTPAGEQRRALSLTFPATLSVCFSFENLCVYVTHNGRPEETALIFQVPDLTWEIFRETNFRSNPVGLFCGGDLGEVSGVRWMLDAGRAQADPKPMRYEDGTPMLTDGRLSFTVSVREGMGGYQAVISMDPSAMDFRMEGALFFDVGDGLWNGDVASSVIYDRTEKRWLVWMCSFSHGHVLARGAFGTDPRHGISVIDVELMEPAGPGKDYTCFEGMFGDEDPDLVKIDGKWHLCICRGEDMDGYHYCRFVSDDPLSGFVFADHTPTSGKTGGSFIRTPEGYFFACGTDKDQRAKYELYPYDDFSKCTRLSCDFDDGGFRGWGTVVCLPTGSRMKYLWITFDRHNSCPDNPWSYGNLYVYDSETFRTEK